MATSTAITTTTTAITTMETITTTAIETTIEKESLEASLGFYGLLSRAPTRAPVPSLL